MEGEYELLKTEDGHGEAVGNKSSEAGKCRMRRIRARPLLGRGRSDVYGTAGPWQFMRVCYVFYTELEKRVGVVVHACHPTTQDAEEGES